MKEIWKDIEWFEWIYQVSNLPRVRSFYKNKYWIWSEAKILSPWTSSWYPIVSLYKNGKWKMYRVHRLKAIAFIPNPENKPCVCHRDNNRANPWLHADWKENLYWGTPSENNQYAYECGKKPPMSMLWRFGKDHNTSKKVNQYTLDWKFIKTRDSLSDIWRILWLDVANISACCRWKKNHSRVWLYLRKYY